MFRIARFSQSALSAVSLLVVSWFAVSLSRSVVVDPHAMLHMFDKYLIQKLNYTSK